MQQERGFTTVEAIIAVIIIILLGLSVWFIWDKNKSDDTKDTSVHTAQDLPANQNSQPQPATETPAKQYLVINEWGVRFTLDQATSDAYYVVQNDRPDYAYVSVKSLVNPECAPEKTSVGVYVRFKQGDRDPTSDQLYTDIYPGAPKVGDYYFFFARAQAYCDETQQAKLEALAKSFNEITKTVEATQ